MRRRFTLVAVHGNGGGGARFARVAPLVPEDVLFVAPTLPGFAERPLEPGLETLADFAGALLRELHGIPRPRVLLGHGLGGTLLLELLQRRPEAGEAVILHAPVGARLERRLLPRLMRAALVRAVAQRALGSALLRPLWRRLLFRRPPPPRELERFFEDYRRSQAFGRLFELVTPAWFAALRPVELPAALLWGERERLLAVGQLEDYRRLLPQARAVRVPDWDHFPMLEAPADYARVVTGLAAELLGLGGGVDDVPA
jgi:pimeloyl-ACP methyl ester carboxylesterase